MGKSFRTVRVHCRLGWIKTGSIFFRGRNNVHETRKKKGLSVMTKQVVFLTEITKQM